MIESKIKRLFAGGIVATMMISLLSGVPASAAGYAEQEYFMQVTDEHEYTNANYANEGIAKEESESATADKKNLADVNTEDTAILTGEAASAATEKARLGLQDENNTDGASVVQDYLHHSGSGASVDESGIVKGSLGEKVTYSLNTITGEVTISGTGAMTDYTDTDSSPFAQYSDVIKRVTIEDGVTSVGASLFGFCYELNEVNLPDTITTIGQWAFLGCVSLDLLYVPTSVTSIGDYSIGYYCDNGKEGQYYKSELNIMGVTGSFIESYATEKGLTFVATDALSNSCGENVTWSFDKETGKLTISGTGDMANYTAYAYPSYKPYYSSIKSVVVEDGVTSVGEYAFNLCGNLEEIKLADSVTTLGYRAFGQCSNLNSVTLSEGLTTINGYAFYGCRSLTQITIPKNVNAIKTHAFSYCSNLKKFIVEEGNPHYATYEGVLMSADKTDLEIFPAGYEDTTFIAPVALDRIENCCFSEAINLKSLVIAGASPVFYTNQNLWGVTVYYDSSDADWTTIQNSLASQGIAWVDMKELVDKSTLSISCESSQVAAGQMLQLVASIDPSLATCFVWESSDEDVAVISNTGRLIAVNPGSTVVTVKSIDNRYTAKRTITVTGNKFEMKSYDYTTLDEDVLQYTSVSTVTKQIISEKLHGIYFLSDTELSFYSFIDKSNTVVQKFIECDDAYVSNNKLYVIGNGACYVYDLNTQSMLTYFSVAGLTGTAVGVDSEGRIYIAGSDHYKNHVYKVRLYSSNGTKISEMVVGRPVYEFSGFDSANGYFYMESYYNYYSWGYDHYGRGLTIGKVTEDTLKYVDTFYGFAEGYISRSMSCLLYLCQSSYMQHQTSAELMGGKYVVATSVLHGSVNVYNSNTASDTGIKKVLSIPRSAIDDGEEDAYSDLSSIGTRSVYNERNNSIILYENNKTISEYSLTTGKKLATFSTKNKVFNLLKMGDSIIAIEKDADGFYIESFDWSEPTKLTIQADSLTMQVGDNQTLTVDSDANYTVFNEWSSSDENVVSITPEGVISAWKAGTATITAKVSNSLTASITITVTASSIVTPASNTVIIEGADTHNASDNHYSVWSKTVNSYLFENTDGTFSKVESLGAKGVKVDVYSKDMIWTSSKTLEAELGIFGGFYSGKDANFLVFGQKNENDSDDVEVLRIVKYSKSWERQGAVSVKGANTYIPFDAGSLRMTETAGKLYIHTCHEMYKGSDGVHHQANMTFVVDEANMKMLDSYYDVMNIAQTGYVSHSFNQFVKTDGQYVYRADHGDANPRAMAITKCKVDGNITDVSYVLPFTMQYYSSYNYTGASIGGFELSTDNCLIAGCSVDQSDEDNFDVFGQRNIFVAVANKAMTKRNVVWLTKYAADYGVTVRTPQMVKLNAEQFLLMWEECNNKTGATVVKMVTIDSEGQMRSDIKEVKLALSDCAPICSSDGLVRWYVTDGKKTIFCVVNPYNLAAVSGEVTIAAPTYDFDDDTNLDDDSEENEDEKDGSEMVGEKFVDIRTGELYQVTGKDEIRYEYCGYKTGDVIIQDTVVISGVTFKVTAIAEKAFKNNKDITSVKIGSNVKTIGAEAFYGCSKLKTVVIGNNVTSIGKSAFYKCTALTKITIPNKVTTIGSKAFYGCKKLRTVSIGKKVKTIGSSAFENCSKLATVKGGAGVQSFGKKSFRKCVSLKKITLQTKVKKLGEQTFYGCKNLKTITIKSKQLKSVGKNAIKNIKKKATIKVPKAKKKAYKKLFKSKTGYKKSMKIK